MITRRAFGWIAAGGFVLVAMPRLAFASGTSSTPTSGLQQHLTPLARFLGKWVGEGDGEPGHSAVERSYEPVVDGAFIMVRNQSSYAPQPKNPKGEVHHDMGILSIDKARKLAVLRQFHTETFVNQYVSPVAALGGGTITFETESLENIPAGFRARETYKWSGPDAFDEVFEVAEPGKDHAVYSHNRLKRA